MVPDVCQIIKWYLYWPKFLQVICCYCSYVWSAQQIRGVFCLDISFTSLFRSIRSLSCCFWNPFSFYQECWRSRSMWIRSLHSWRSWWSKRQRVRQYHNVQCRDILVGLLEDVYARDYFPQLPKYRDFWSISIQIQGIMKLCSRVKWLTPCSNVMWLIFFLCHVVEESEMVCCFNCS